MDAETVVLGKAYECQPVGIKRRIVGEVISKMEKCVVLNVIRYDGIDNEDIEERCGRVVAKYDEIYGPALIDCFFS